MSVLSAIAEHEYRIKNIFIDYKEGQGINEQAMFGLKMLVGGEQKNVILDNYIPCDSKHNSPIFTRANSNELWVIMMEKAWAKIHGSYEKIIGGQSHFALRDCTGAPSYEYDDDREGMFDDIMKGERNNWIMTAGINASSYEQTEAM